MIHSVRFVRRFTVGWATSYAVIMLLGAFVAVATPKAFPGDPPLNANEKLLAGLAEAAKWLFLLGTFPASLVTNKLLWGLGFVFTPGIWAAIFALNWQQLESRRAVR